MTLHKSSQIIDEIVDMIEEEAPEHKDHDDEVILYEEKPSPEDVIEMHQPEVLEVEIKLPKLPGALDSDVIEVCDDDNDVEIVDNKKDSKKDKNDAIALSADPWDWKKSGGLSKAFEWIERILANVPKHSGNEISGIERAVSYLERADAEMSRMIQTDINGDIDIAKFEKIRNEILDAIDRLNEHGERLSKKRSKKSKKAENTNDEMNKVAAIGGFVVSVPVLISRIARVCINGTVSAGRDIEDLFARQVKKYDLNVREQAELMQVLSDYGFPLRRDRGYLMDEEMDTTSDGGFDYAQNFNG